MDKKLPEVFANKVNRKIGNNEDVYYGSKDKYEEVRSIKAAPIKGKNINQKLNEIFNSPNYIYKADVVLKLKNGTVTKRIVGRNATHLITFDNELIPITDVIDIERQ